MNTHRIVCAAACGALFATAASAGTVVFDQGFETDTSGWSNGGGGYGNFTRVASGTGGIASSSGGYHAIFTQTTYGSYTFFDGSRDTWPGGMTASVDVYLDTGMTDGEGFDYSVAAYNQSNAHLQDFIFHVSKDISTGQLLVGGSNNTSFDPRQDLDTINHYAVTADGWYTLQHVFYDLGDGTLAVDMNLVDAGGTILFTETRNTSANILATVVGGNGYGWFTNIDVTGGIAVDNSMLEIASIIPLPSAAGLAGLGLVATGVRRRRALA